MFKPFKHLITYIQKNASTTAIFGSSAPQVDVMEATDVKNGEVAMKEEEATHELVTESKLEMDKVDRNIVGKPLNSDGEEDSSYKSSAEALADEMEHPNEMKAKEPKDECANSSKEVLDEQQNEAEALRAPLTVHHNDGMRQSFESIESVMDREGDSSFLNLSTEFDDFPSSEMVVLSDHELTSPLNADSPSEDPLAIEELAEQRVISDRPKNTPISNGSSGDILWINIDDIKSCDITPEQQNELCSVSTEKQSCGYVCEQVDPLNRAVNEDMNNMEELPSDGSDSGLGLDTTSTSLHSGLITTADLGKCNMSTLEKATDMDGSRPTKAMDSNADEAMTTAKMLQISPLRSNLKRRLKSEDDSLDSSTGGDAELKSSEKKPKRSVNFDTVHVYYFPRQQGFSCVPSAGGCTLGMSSHHVSFKTLTLTEHAAELRRAHRQQLQEVNPRGSSSDDSEESEEDYLSEGSGSDLDTEASGFLQPVLPKQRRALLKAAGVRKIDASEKGDCRNIRNSREVCGCTCRDFCDPETCSCSQAGIKCQVDRAAFPCGCSRDACGNAIGRIEFNPSRVRTHFIHTIMRLEMESRHRQKPLSTSYNASSVSPGNSSTSTSTSSLNAMATSYYGNLQSQSNYSSGYASPAYPNESQPFYPHQSQQPQQQQQHYVDSDRDIDSDNAVMQTHQSTYPVDALEANLFPNGTTIGPSYGDLLPTYGSSTGGLVSATVDSSAYHGALNYPTLQNGIAPITPYAGYSHISTSYLASNTSTNMGSFSSCSVPSSPPFGTVTTTTASVDYHSSDTLLETTAAAMVATTTAAIESNNHSSHNFVNLNSPISSSSRLSAINDLLQHNRNASTALVAVGHSSSSPSLPCTLADCSTNDDITTMDVMAATAVAADYSSHNSCLSFDELPAPLNPTAIISAIESANVNNNEDEAFTNVVAAKVPPLCAGIDTNELPAITEHHPLITEHPIMSVTIT